MQPLKPNMHNYYDKIHKIVKTEEPPMKCIKLESTSSDSGVNLLVILN